MCERNKVDLKLVVRPMEPIFPATNTPKDKRHLVWSEGVASFFFQPDPRFDMVRPLSVVASQTVVVLGFGFPRVEWPVQCEWLDQSYEQLPRQFGGPLSFRNCSCVSFPVVLR